MLKFQAIIRLLLISGSIIFFIIFFDHSVSRNALSKPKNREICEIRAFDIFDCEGTCDLTDVTASIYDIKYSGQDLGLVFRIKFYG